VGLDQFGEHRLTSVEFTLSNRCNMRCEHCAVGQTLVMQEPPLLPLDDMIRCLEGVEHLSTISITGGEPTFSRQTVRDYIVPLLQYARSRGIYSQLNSNVTLDYARYEEIAPFLDVMHISFNYTEALDFHNVGFTYSEHPVKYDTAARLYEQMVENTRKLAEGGLLVSAESMINYRTHMKLAEIHRLIAQMGCKRHEVHPMYATSCAENLPMLAREDMLAAINGLLDVRDPDLWMLFGTLPFYACSQSAAERELLARLANEPKVTVRGDPDGRNRLNVNGFTGEVFVTDFADISSFGNIKTGKLDDIFASWLAHPLMASVNCHCPAARCSGPNLLVKQMYYADADFHDLERMQHALQ
jgi:radical SAM/CxCxxxxC motif protein YfkAB